MCGLLVVGGARPSLREQLPLRTAEVSRRSVDNEWVSKPLRGEEEWLRQCIEAAIPGATVTQHDDGSRNSMHDLDVWVNSERVGAVEISAAVDPQALELWRLVSTPRQWTDATLAGGWMVSVSRTARARALKTSLPGLLRALESQGVRRLDEHVGGAATVEREYAESLGIVSVFQSPTAHPGSVYVQVDLPPHQSGGGAPDTADPVAMWVGQWLQRADQLDNLGKLARSGTRQRHMAVLVAGVSPAPFAVNYALMDDDVALPTLPPQLPSELTHCWIVSSWSSGRGLVWSPGGWAWFDKLQPAV